MRDTQELAVRYVSLWNQADARQRRETIGWLWAEDGVHSLQPPIEMRKRAAELGLVPTLQATGLEQIERRAGLAYQEFVAPGEFVFRLGEAPDRVGDVVKLSWEMARTSDGKAVGGGVDVLLLDEEDKIRLDTQFINP